MKGVDLSRYAVALILLSIPLFIQLGDQTIRLWDESRLVTNAWEMYNNRNFLVLYFNGEPDMWNTKPPLLIWLQALSIHLFGLSEFSVRFPSALAGLLTCLVLIVFSDRFLNDTHIGFLAAFVLVTLKGYNGLHVTRTADFDALLILFMTISALAVFRFSERRRAGDAAASCVFIGLAVLTKGVAGFLFLPGLLLYLLYTRSLIQILKTGRFWLGVLAVVIVVGAFYGLREYLNPGFFTAVYENELGGRFFEVNENHGGGFFYYLKPIFSNYWMYFIPVILFPFFTKTKERIRRFHLFALILAGSFFLVISISKTKLPWYTAPLYPLLACAFSIGFLSLSNWILEKGYAKITVIRIVFGLLSIFPLMISIYPLNKALEKTFSPETLSDGSGIFEMSSYLNRSLKAGKDLSGYCFPSHQYQPHAHFYIYKLNNAGVDLHRCEMDELNAGDRLIFWEDEIEEELNLDFEYELTSRTGQVREAKIKFRK